MANARALQKTMSIGEGGSALAFVALAIASIVIAAKAYTPEYAFHAYLFAAASIAAVFVIINRYYDRPAATPPLEIDGKPNYNMGPVKFATVAAVFWGIAGFTVGALYRVRTGVSASQFRPAMGQFRAAAAAAHLGRDLRLRRQRADRHLVLCRAAHLPRAARRRYRALVRRARLQLLHRHRRHRLSARHHPVEGICRAGMVRRPVPDRRLGDLFPRLSRHHHAAQGAAHLRRQLVLSRLHPHHRRAASRQQRGDPGLDLLVRSPTSSGRACRTPWCSGGTATTRSASSSPPASSPSCTTSSRSGRTGRSIPTGCRSSTSGR